jgi:hypothetical protein
MIRNGEHFLDLWTGSSQEGIALLLSPNCCWHLENKNQGKFTWLSIFEQSKSWNELRTMQSETLIYTTNHAYFVMLVVI